MEQQQENGVSAQPAQVRMTVSITRKATGLVETYELIGTPVPADDTPEQPKEES